MDVREYLQNKGFGYEQLSEDERKAISDFSLIWTLFESQLLENSANSNKILSKCEEWVKLNLIEESVIDSSLSYFRERYVHDGAPSHRFEHLHLRKNDRPELIWSVLVGESEKLELKMACCLIIAFRFRNNYFHGVKWAYQFAEQRENFEHSCLLLTKLIDVYF
ncbi:hypothetical protein [Alteromonas portus]|uniref:hypothetical protein n=1 Tax=Alteromonas portus TaxID=2565549 RepID=UPI003BF8150C